jgi:hypothetical protein
MQIITDPLAITQLPEPDVAGESAPTKPKHKRKRQPSLKYHDRQVKATL